MTQACWCGGNPSARLDDAYALCDSCGTVVYTAPYDVDDYTSTTHESAFYGNRYWQTHVPEELGLPGLAERARTDLSERAVYYLSRVLARVAPRQAVLELGCAPGCVSYLMNQAGLQATGIELGQATVEFVRHHFGIEVYEGPLECVDLDQRFDALLAIDVLEHLPNPLTTLRACRARLTDTGALMLQTPCYRGQQADWSMLVPAEHLFLYTETSVRALLQRAGFTVAEVGPSLFPHDMWVVATPGASLAKREDELAGVPPQTAGLIRLYRYPVAQNAERLAVERDRSTHAAIAKTAHDRLEAVRADQRAKADLIASASQELEAVRADQRAKADLIASASQELEAVRADQRAKADLIASVSQELEAVRADQRAKADLIASASQELEAVRADQRAKADLIASVSQELEAVRADQRAKADLIASVSQELEAVRADQRAKAELIARVTNETDDDRTDGRTVGRHDTT